MGRSRRTSGISSTPCHVESCGWRARSCERGVPRSEGMVHRSHMSADRRFGGPVAPNMAVAVSIVRVRGETTTSSNGSAAITGRSAVAWRTPLAVSGASERSMDGMNSRASGFFRGLCFPCPWRIRQSSFGGVDGRGGQMPTWPSGGGGGGGGDDEDASGRGCGGGTSACCCVRASAPGSTPASRSGALIAGIPRLISALCPVRNRNSSAFRNGGGADNDDVDGRREVWS